MAARTGRLGNASYKKETSWGTYIAGDTKIRISTESLARTIEHTEDPALVGEIYTTDMIKVGDGIGGSMEAVMHGDEVGELIWGVLGGQSSATQPAKAWILVSYSGVSNYARLTKSGSTITAELSSAGSSWTVDTNWSSLGTIDTSLAANDTLSELTAVIAAKTGWDAILFGDSMGSSLISDFTATNVRSADVRVGGYLLKSQVTSTTAKMHTIYPAAATLSLPSFSFTLNRVLGANKSIGAVGCKINTIVLSSAAKDLCKYSLTIDGKQESIDQNDTSVTVPTIEGFLAANMKIVVEQPDGSLVEMDEVKDYSLTINANLDDNRVIGSYYKKEQERQGATIEFSFTANNTDTQYALRTNYTGDTSVGMYIYWKSNDYADTTNSIPYSMLIRIPDAKLTDFNSPLSTPDRLTITGAGKVIKALNTTYNKHIYAYVIDADTSSY